MSALSACKAVLNKCVNMAMVPFSFVLAAYPFLGIHPQLGMYDMFTGRFEACAIARKL